MLPGFIHNPAMSLSPGPAPFEGSRPRQARHRVIQTCLPCHRAKRKCNRKKPCSQCLRRHMTGSCVYEAVSEVDLQRLQDNDAGLAAENAALRSRLRDLEAAVTDFRDQLRETKGALAREKQRHHNNNGGNDEVPRPGATRDDRGGVYYGRTYYLGGPAAPDLLQRMLSLVPNEQTDMLFAYSGASNGLHPPDALTAYAFPTFPANYTVKDALDALHTMGRQAADSRLDAFYELVDPVHHYVPTPWLMQRYEQCWNAEAVPEAQEVALICSVLALGDLVSSNEQSWFLLAVSMQLLRISNMFATPTLDTIHTFCYIAVYLQHEGRISEYWPMLGLVIRLAQSLALHRDPSTISNLTPEESEIRRRLFWVVAAQETALSVMFGRPNGMGFFDCKLPKDIGDDELFGAADGQVAHAACNEISYHLYTWELGQITRTIMDGAFGDLNDMTHIKATESRIWAWFESLPAHFKFDPLAELHDDYSVESKKRYVQSVLLYIIVNHNILVLFRKPLLANADPAVRKPCFEAAFAVAAGWKILQDTFPKMARITFLHWFRAFHAALICLVCIRTDGPQSQFRGKALNAWSSCLRIFARIKDQNTSISACWRALSRLNVVMKKEMEGEQRHRRFSMQKRVRDSSYQLLITPTASAPLESSVDELVQPMPGSAAESSSAMAKAGAFLLDPDATPDLQQMSGNHALQLDTAGSGFDQSALDGLGMGDDLPIFDMDIQNWPAWLTDNSPNCST